MVDTLRADHLSSYGYPRATSPHLDRLAAESVVFEQAFTVMGHTLPAHVSLLIGVHPASHHVVANGTRYDGPYPTLAERLHERGWSAAAFVSGLPLERVWIWSSLRRRRGGTPDGVAVLVPEPATCSLVLGGLVGLALNRRRAAGDRRA